MTRWGVILLLLYLGLGLSNTPRTKAITLSVCVTAIVLTGVMASYLR